MSEIPQRGLRRLKVLIERLRNLRKKVTNPFWRAKSRYIKYFDRLPLDARIILLESEHGKKIDGNIFYLLKYLSDSPRYGQYRIYCSSVGRNLCKFQAFLSDHDITRVTLVVQASDQYMRLLASAKYLINDTSFPPYFLKKKGQIYLNLWHGTPLKTMGKADQSGFHAIGNVQKNFLDSDYLLYPNDYMKEIMLRDYMLENIGRGELVLGGYPRNEAFFDDKSRQAIRERMRLTDKRIYAYLPTFRGSVDTGGSYKNDTYFSYYLFELDARLSDEEILFVNLHPLARKNVDFGQFRRIQAFPPQYETYEFLNAADTLVTDYSSVFFDYACSGRKIVLFPYDKEEYWMDRGMYLSLDELPFPQAKTVDDLLWELRAPKEYDDRAFLERFCPFEGPDASRALCDYVILGEDTPLAREPIPDNGKENVLIYAGDLATNGITISLRSLLNIIDLNKRNYILSVISEVIQKNRENLRTFPPCVSYYASSGDLNLTVFDRVIRKLFKKKWLTAAQYMRLSGRRVRQDLDRVSGSARIDAVIQFNGYEQEVILRMSAFPGRKAIFVHSDMLREIQTKGIQRADVLRYAYRHYDSVAVVTQDLAESTRALSRRADNICVAKNAIDVQSVLEKSQREIALDPDTRVFPSRERFEAMMALSQKKYISIGRFSPEKGHDRLLDAFNEHRKKYPDCRLIILGGVSLNRGYEKLIEQVKRLRMEDSVVLLLKVSNPYPILKSCDYFVLSSHYEGFGLVLAEADILGKPVVCTDISGPRSFMQQNGGTLVEDSLAGLCQGMEALYQGEVQSMRVDYAAYNREVVQKFEDLLSPKDIGERKNIGGAYGTAAD